MKQFETGKTYTTRSVYNSNCILTITVISRTASTIKAFVDNEVRTLLIDKKISGFRNAETVLPYGIYSMYPAISAE